MKKKIRFEFNSLRRGDCFRLTLKGPVYMKDSAENGQIVLGRGLGRIWTCGYGSKGLVYPAKVKIVEIK